MCVREPFLEYIGKEEKGEELKGRSNFIFDVSACLFHFLFEC